MVNASNTPSRRKSRSAAASCCPAPKLRARPIAGFAEFFKALGDPTRLEVVGLLAAHGKELCVCEIEPRFQLSQPTVSHHLRILREAGIVSAERRGTWVYYTLEPHALERIKAFGAELSP